MKRYGIPGCPSMNASEPSSANAPEPNSRNAEPEYLWLDAAGIQPLVPSCPGSYLLLMFLPRPATICAGKLPRRTYTAGWYVYAGSALKGLRARLSRYVRPGRARHWHIDYLLEHACLRGAYILESPERYECRLAARLAERLETVNGFGASDCRCKSHLFHDSDEECMRTAITFALSGRFTISENIL